jgi:hypothetical protein
MSELRDAVDKALGPAPVSEPRFSAATPMDLMADELFKAVKGYVDKRLEGSRTMHFDGPFDLAKSYRAGACVQKNGAIWVAMVACKDQSPGASDAWRRIGSA